MAEQSFASVKIESHIKEAGKAMDAALLRALEACGGMAETYAKENLTNANAVDTGALRNSITHKVIDSEKACVIGSNLEYAPYVELGTGVYYPGGRQTPWLYEDADGNVHITRGMQARPYLKPAVEEHRNEYKKVIENELEK